MTIDSYYRLPKGYRNQITLLVFSSFMVSELPRVKYHYVLCENQKVLGYCAVSKRPIQIENNFLDYYLLGLFTIASESRNKGLGTKLLQFIIQDPKLHNANGLILNCGKNLVNFYIRNSFSIISECAEYYRNKKFVVDYDPVLIFPFNKKIHIMKTNACIRIGKDF